MPRQTHAVTKQARPAISTLFAFLHHLAAFTLVSAVAIEFTVIRQEITHAEAKRLIAVDTVLGIAATALLVIGLLRVFYFEKGAVITSPATFSSPSCRCS